MSYSFTERADSKAAVQAKLQVQMDHLTKHQPAHVERQAVQGLAQQLLDVLPEPGKGQLVQLQMSGSVSGMIVDGSTLYDPVMSLNASITVTIVPA